MDLLHAPRPVKELGRHEVSRGGQTIGELVELEIDDPRGKVRFFRVLNADRQYLGYVDAQGRFYKRVPFREDELFVGAHTMESGLALLYEVSEPLVVRAAPKR